MINYDDWEEFDQYIIAQDDDNDYEESGYVVAVKDGVAAIACYSHCSCYGTHECIESTDLTTWDWSGTVDELIKMATKILDPNMPEREADPEDFDYDHLCNVYQQVRKHFNVGD